MLNKFIVYFIAYYSKIWFGLNIYDTKTIRCVKCDSPIGEVDYDAEIILPKCGQCANPTPHPKDKMPYLMSHYFKIFRT